MKLVREHINEKFTEDSSDPIFDMGIGLKYKVQKWIDDNIKNKNTVVFKTPITGYHLERENIIINDDLTIDVKGWVDVSGEYGINLPENIRFNHIYNDFVCSFDVINYAKYMPKQVDGEIRFYMMPYPKDPEEIKQEIRKVCKVKKEIKIK
jgi:hypothetical protein